MRHYAIDQVLRRAESSKSDSDFTYFFDLLLVAEALAKIVVLGISAAIADDKDRNRYRIEHAIVRASGLGDWARAIEDMLSGAAADHLIAEAKPEQLELTRLSRGNDWQYLSILAIKNTLNYLNIEAEELPTKSDMKRWFRLLATLRNKTRGHGATRNGNIAGAALLLKQSIDHFYENFSLFNRPQAYLHANLSGKYRISPISGNCTVFDHLKREIGYTLKDGVYIYWNQPRLMSLIHSNPELDDFYLSNGNFSAKKYELLSYLTDNKVEGNSSEFLAPPGTLPDSDTDGKSELLPRGNCLSNAPNLIEEYVERPELESELLKLLLDDKRSIVTLRGRGGIGKTSLALRVMESVYSSTRYGAVIWLSSRDVDLNLNGPKIVRPSVVSAEDMSRLYAELVLSDSARSSKGFNAKNFFEGQLQESDSGSTLFIFDNFETTQSPVEMFTWIDTYIRLPNKVLITTRLRDFKGDYPLDVSGMKDNEALQLIHRTAAHLGIEEKINKEYSNELIRQSEGHPYVIKILLGEVARTGNARNITQIVAGSDEILTALFERTYSSLSPCAQRAFLTLSAWNSSVPRIALEAVLLRSTNERQEVESGIESLLQYSLAEVHLAPTDDQEFLSLPLVASVFGKKKLNISPHKSSIHSDVELLQMLGPSKRGDLHLGLARRLESFVSKIAKRIDEGAKFEDYESMLEMICRSYAQGWLLLARWHIETGTGDSLNRAKGELTRFLENEPTSPQASEAWRLLAYVCFRLGDVLGEIHAFIERAQLALVPFYDVSNTANRLSQLLREHDLEIERETKRDLAERLLIVMDNRRREADSDDYSRMAWLAIHMGQETKAREYVRLGLAIDSSNYHCQKLASRMGLTIEGEPEMDSSE